MNCHICLYEYSHSINIAIKYGLFGKVNSLNSRRIFQPSLMTPSVPIFSLRFSKKKSASKEKVKFTSVF